MQEWKRNIDGLKDFFLLPQIGYIFASMAAGFTPSKFFADNKNKPSFSLAWDRGNCFFFAGEINSITEARRTIEFFKTEILKEEIRSELGVAKLYYPSENWEGALVENLKEYKPLVLERVLYKHNLHNIPGNWQGKVRVKEIDENLVGNPTLGNLELVTQEIGGMWGTVDRFLENGFGTCALEENEIICWCTAEYLSQGFCGIGIETIEERQNKGIATATTLAFLNKCSQLGLHPYWDCWKNNIPSVRVAEKTGFEKVIDYRIVLLDFSAEE